jgi:hypothetical protein
MNTINGFIIVSLILCTVSCKQKISPTNQPTTSDQKVVKSEKQNTTELQGNWKLTDIDFSAYYATLSSETRVRLENEMEQQLKLIEGQAFYEFKGTNRLILESPSEKGDIEKSNGSFKLSDDKDSLYLIFEDEIETYHISYLQGNKLVLTTKETPDRTLTFFKLN